MSTLLTVTARDFDAEFEAFLKKRLETYALSPTSLNRFLENPQEFLEIDLLERPQAKQPAFAYGNAVHHALAKWAIAVQAGQPIDDDAFVAAFSDHLLRKEILTATERASLEHLGREALPRYAAERLTPPYPTVHRVEFALGARLGDIPIKGKIDRIEQREPDSAVVTVRDFKTGKPKTEKQCRDLGYVRQLVFYALLLEHGMPILKPEAFILDFIGERDGHPVERVFQVSESDKKELSELIETVWRKILALDFTAL